MAYEPKDIEIEEMENGWYMVFYIDDEGFRKSLHVPNPEEFANPFSWMLELDDTKLEAAIQIYYDKWNFEEGKKRDKSILDTLVEERDRRKAKNPSFAPGIFTATSLLWNDLGQK